MSDVWQGPGWWLASDGKWYPADAKPGAVYEGDLTNAEESTTARADAAAVPDSAGGVGGVVVADTPAPEPVVESTPIVEAVATEPVATAPVITPVEPVTDVPSMPEPVVESAGGWQTIAGDGSAAPVQEPDVEAAAGVVDEGWTSAFEERAASGVVLDDLPGAEATPPVIDLPEVAAPDVGVPDVGVPDVGVPDVGVPNVGVPQVNVPDVTVPDVGIPEVSVPDVTVPDVGIPEVSVPYVTVPDVGIPEVSVPEVSVPDVTVPDVGAPDVTAPAVTTPDVVFGDAPAADAAAGAGLAAPLAGAGIVEAIEREDAWRKPGPGETPRIEPDASRKAPDVVDLAIREDIPEAPVEEPKRNWKMLVGLLAVLALIGLIAWLIAELFAGNSTTDTTSTTTTTVEVADTSDEPDDTTATSAEDTTASSPDTTEADSSSTTQESSVFDLRAGDCIVGDIGAGQVTRVEKVDCELEHQFEVYREALIESSIVEFDEAAISAYAEDVCRTSLAAYIPADDDRNLKFKFLQPTEDSWNQPEDPDRVITCLLFDGDGDPLIGRAN